MIIKKELEHLVFDSCLEATAKMQGYDNVEELIKDEFYLDQCFFRTQHAKQATKNAIKL